MANTRKTFWYVTQSAAVYRSAKVWFDNREAALRYHDAHNYTDAPKAVTFRRSEKNKVLRRDHHDPKRDHEKGVLIMAKTAKFDIYETITNRIIAELEKGVIPWQKP